MNDFILKYGSNITFNGPILPEKIIFNKELETSKLKFEKFEITVKRFTDDNEFDYYNSEESLTLIYGRVFSKYKSTFSTKSIVTAKDINSLSNKEY
ncbi:hypothetical protein C4577_00835, partial [Candidatus Parcubacteria bacterium]